MTRQANILSFDEVKAREASLPRTVSPSSSSRRAYEAHRNAEEGATRRTSSRSNTPRVSSARSYREASASRFAEGNYAQLQSPSQERAPLRGYDRVVFDNFTGDFTKGTKLLLVDVLNQGIAYRGGTYRVGSVISLYVADCFKALGRKLSIDEIEPFGVV